MGFFTKTVEREVGHCMSCGKPMIAEVKESDGSIYSKPDFTLKDETFICEECFLAKAFDSTDFKGKWTKADLLQKFKEKNLVSPDEFTPTKRIYRVVGLLNRLTDKLPYLEIDEGRKLINIPEYRMGGLFSKTKYADNVVPFSAIVGFQLVDDGKTEGSVLAETAGATADLLDGDIISAALGALSASNIKKCKELSMKIILDDMNDNTRYIHFIGNDCGVPALERKDVLFKDILKKGVEEVASVLTVIMKRNQSKVQAGGGSENLIDKIKQLAELKDAGIISPEEFEAKKTELMGRL